MSLKSNLTVFEVYFCNEQWTFHPVDNSLNQHFNKDRKSFLCIHQHLSKNFTRFTKDLQVKCKCSGLRKEHEAFVVSSFSMLLCNTGAMRCGTKECAPKSPRLFIDTASCNTEMCKLRTLNDCLCRDVKYYFIT